MVSDKAIIDVEDVFVDRDNALLYLEVELQKRKNRKKEKAIHITQAPGTGKTRLLQEFIKKMAREKKAVGIYINSSDIENWIYDLEGLRKVLRRAAIASQVSELTETLEPISETYMNNLIKKIWFRRISRLYRTSRGI